MLNHDVIVDGPQVARVPFGPAAAFASLPVCPPLLLRSWMSKVHGSPLVASIIPRHRTLLRFWRLLADAVADCGAVSETPIAVIDRLG